MTSGNHLLNAVPGEGQPANNYPFPVLVLRSAAYVLIFIFWLGATAVLIRAGYRNTSAFVQADPELYVKLTTYDTLEEPPDIVFIGTSRVYRQVNTPVLEKVLEVNGCSNISTYNFGFGGATVSNTRFVLDWLLAQKARPKLILLEHGGAFLPNSQNSNRAYLYTPFFAPRIWSLSGGLKDTPAFLEMIMNKGVFHRLTQENNEAVFDISLAGENGFRRGEEVLPAGEPRRAALEKLLREDPDFFPIFLGGIEKISAKFQEKQKIDRPFCCAVFAVMSCSA